jgi:hypothetical protein
MGSVTHFVGEKTLRFGKYGGEKVQVGIVDEHLK